MTAVVDKCLEVGVAPIISWISHQAEACATEDDRRNYVLVDCRGSSSKAHRNYHLSFNRLFTELRVDGGGGEKCPCSESLRENTAKYNIWTFEVIKAIRATRGNNTERILIVGSPGKTAKDLPKIDKGIYESDQYMLAEWHLYASGPNKKVGGQKYWSGNGIPDGRANVKKSIKYATEFIILLQTAIS